MILLIKYILKRVAIGLATLFILTTVVFVLMKSLPGGPFDSERVTDPRVIEIMERAYNLDKPYHIQYLLYLRDLRRAIWASPLKNPALRSTV